MGRGRATSSPILTAVLPCLAAVIVALLPRGVQPVTVADSQAAALKECAAEWGMRATGWAQGADCAQAKGVTCDKDGMVTQLLLNSNGLTGSIPLALTALPRLRLLDLQSNSLSGPLPPALSALRLLTSLKLGENFLTGPVFTVIARMQSLVELELYSNSFTGPIPLTASRLQNLTSLALNNNDFHGPFPPAFTHITALAYLYAPNNNITGSIPATITALSRLASLEVSANPLFSGSLPRALSRLTTLRVLSAPPLPHLLLLPLTCLRLSCSCSSTSPPCFDSNLHPSAPPLTTPSCTPLIAPAVSPLMRPTHPTTARLTLLYLCGWPSSLSLSTFAASAPMLKRSTNCPHIPLADILRVTDGWAEGRLVGGGRWSNVYRGEWVEAVEGGDGEDGGKDGGEDGGKDAEGTGKKKKTEGGDKGEGSQGKQLRGANVWKGGRPGEKWAVKRLWGGAHGAARAEFEAHVAGLARLGHSNVLSLVGWCCCPLQEEGERGGSGREVGNEMVLVYKWMERGSLEAALQPGAAPLSLQQRVGVAVGVLRALKAVQSHGQVHGDLKPSNVLLGASYEVRAMLPPRNSGSRSSSSGGGRGQKVYVLRCTEGHMDPAVVQTGIATPTSDMYSVGVLLLQLFTGWAGPFRDVDGQRTHIYDW
ncbi:unnamed protein product, partial [Closterium sp. Yama58-4]